MTTRTYVIRCYVRDGAEPEGTRTYHDGSTRTVEYADGAKYVTYCFTA